MQSRWPYLAAFNTHLTFTTSGIFLSSTRYFKMFMRPWHAACIAADSRRFHFGEKKSKTVEVSSISSLFTRLFFIIRAIIREAVLQHLEITFTCGLINRPFIPLALFHFSRPLEQLEFVLQQLARKTRLDLSHLHLYFRENDSTRIPASKWM